MSETKEGPKKSRWRTVVVLLLFVATGAWGGWTARGKMDVCGARPNYGALNLTQDAAVATGHGIAYAAGAAWDGVLWAKHKIFKK